MNLLILFAVCVKSNTAQNAYSDITKETVTMNIFSFFKEHYIIDNATTAKTSFKNQQDAFI
jgi:hypothetical protein